MCLSPSWISKGSLELRELTLGEQTPCVTRIRTLDYNGDDETSNGGGGRSTSTRLCIEADLNLDCEQFRMLIATRLFGKGCVYTCIEMDLVSFFFFAWVGVQWRGTAIEMLISVRADEDVPGDNGVGLSGDVLLIEGAE